MLAASLRDGIARDELVLHYQPKLALESGDVVGVEALVRWRHPQRGLIPPTEFIELAERTDVIDALTMNVLRNALGQVTAWRRVGIELPVAVNLPAQMLLDRDLPGDVASLLARFGLDARNLVLEITEGSLIHDPHRSAQILDTLSQMGVRIAIDDFRPRCRRTLRPTGATLCRISGPVPAAQLLTWLRARREATRHRPQVTGLTGI